MTVSLTELKNLSYPAFENAKELSNPSLWAAAGYFAEINATESFRCYLKLTAAAKAADNKAPGSVIDVAYSGGVDSTALVLYLYLKSKAFVRETGSGFRIVLHHMNHGIRKNTDDLRIVKSLAAQLSLDLHIYTPEEDLSVGGNVEERARRERKLAFPPDIFTAHHMDDSVETMFLNLLRGTGLTGTSIKQNGFRPFLGVQKDLLKQFVSCFDVEFVHDETNDSAIYRRNRIRNEVIPLLNDIAGKNVIPNLNRFGDICHDSQMRLEKDAVQRYETLTETKIFGSGGQIQLSVQTLQKLDKYTAKIVLLWALRENGIFLRTSTLEALYECVVAANSAFQISKQYRLVKHEVRGQDYFYLEEQVD